MFVVSISSGSRSNRVRSFDVGPNYERDALICCQLVCTAEVG